LPIDDIQDMPNSDTLEKITKGGDIIWHENADGLETFRTYKLNDNGLFQIIHEEQKGEAEF
jgi:hypothetical protein